MDVKERTEAVPESETCEDGSVSRDVVDLQDGSV